MIAILLLAAAPVVTAVDAENAFARDAKRMGQWSAFRKWGDRDAVMFTPKAVWASTFLKTLKNPPNSITWRAANSYVSCDGRTAVNTGPWFQQDGNPGGYFTTIWQRTGKNWRWVYDGGGPSAEPAPAKGIPQIRVAACGSRATGAPITPPPTLSAAEARKTRTDNGRGESADKTIGWDWKVEKDGARRLRVYQWTGKRYSEVLHNDVPAPPAK